MSDALPLPPRPDLGQYRNLARDLQRAANSGDPAAVRAWASRWPDHADRVAGGWDRTRKPNGPNSRRTLAEAQFFLARSHGFASWPRFAKHVDALARADSSVRLFESAADAVIAGDVGILRQLLRDHPDLVRMRSTREHGSTLLHYVSANGVEDFRQKTPLNIVEIASLLLDAGADPAAESGAYGGSTVLNLAATSAHPAAAGVQLDLLDLLLARGAAMGDGDVTACLHNGRGRAAAFLAARGARLDFEGAAGVGQVDRLSSLLPGATVEQRTSGFAWACEFGRTSVVDYLLEQGMDPNAPLPHNRQTGLHWAAYGGYPDTVKTLLDRGGDVNAKDGSFDGTPLEWALYGWGNPPEFEDRPWHETVALLARAGGALDPGWFHETDTERRRAIRKLQADSRMQAALRGEL
jgi:ankyrin repeat protein